MITPALLGPIDVLAEEVLAGVLLIEFVLLGLVVTNLVTRAVSHFHHVRTYRHGEAAEITRSTLHEVTNALLVIGALYYVTVQVHSGVIFTTLVIGLVITDFFEFEARLVEARKEATLERPKSALFASSLVFLYIAYQSLFFLIRPFWELVV